MADIKGAGDRYVMIITWLLAFIIVSAFAILAWRFERSRQARMLARGESPSARSWLIFFLLMVGATLFSVAVFLFGDHEPMHLLRTGVFVATAVLLWRAYSTQRGDG
jgi:nicotinamide riboside transporter PnuC